MRKEHPLGRHDQKWSLSKIVVSESERNTSQVLSYLCTLQAPSILNPSPMLLQKLYAAADTVHRAAAHPVHPQ